MKQQSQARQLAEGVIEGIKSYYDTIGEQQQLKGQILTNEIKMRMNPLYQLNQEKVKNMQALRERYQAQNQPGVFGAGADELSGKETFPARAEADKAGAPFYGAVNPAGTPFSAPKTEYPDATTLSPKPVVEPTPSGEFKEVTPKAKDYIFNRIQEKEKRNIPLSAQETSFRDTYLGGGKSYATATSDQDIKDTVTGVFEGTLPPEKLASYRDVTRVNAEIQRQSKSSPMRYPDLLLEWDATKAYVKNANSTVQLKLRQSIGFAQESVENIKKLSAELKRTNSPIINRAQMELAKQGAFGQEMAKKAVLLDQQIADTVADLGQVYMGGNSPTDHGLKLAGTNLQGNWSIPVLEAAADNVGKLLNFRMNAINNAVVQGVGGPVKGTYGKSMSKTTTPLKGNTIAEQKANLANEIRAANPNLTDQEVIDGVNQDERFVQ
jgi:subtilisin-like proprotein convertase family protein